ncbi:MAG: fibronectin type III domain-containing protein, partial [Patescibacteria group bacterium]
MSTETQVQAREGTARNSSTGGVMLIVDKTDKQAPLISEIKTSDIKSDSVVVSWVTDEDADSFVEYGAGDLGGNFGKYEMVKNHSAVIKNLLSDKDYVFKVASRDASGNLSVSSQGSFSTLSLSEELDQGGSGDSMLKSALEKTIGIIKLVSSHVSIGTMENALEVSYDSIEDLANIVPAPFMSGEPRMEITPTTATISWFTDKDSNSLVAIAREGEYDPEKENPYLQVIGLPEDDTKFHAVTMYDLEPDTVYHYQLRNQPKVGPMSKSKDFVFKTNKEALEIVTHTIQKVSQKEAAFKWITNASTDSTVKYIPYRNNVLSIDEAKI